MPIFLSLLMAVQALTYRVAPVGSVLHVRLTSAVGSFASRPGDMVEAVLIAPVKVEGEIILPAGAILHGRVKSVRRVGLGILREASSLDLTFDSITLPGGASLAVSTQLASVDNGREESRPREPFAWPAAPAALGKSSRALSSRHYAAERPCAARGVGREVGGDAGS